MAPNETALLTQLSEGPLTSSELQQRLGLSQPTVSRLIRNAGHDIARIGRGRATRYVRAATIFDTQRTSLPLFNVDPQGMIKEQGRLHALWNGGYLLRPSGDAFWLLGLGGQGLFESLPYFLHDLRPSGFLGRQLARRLADEWGVPQDPRAWTDRQIGQYLVRRGDDLPGNLLLGDAAAARANRRTDQPAVVDRARAYPELALRALREEEPGSSAAGEQPKFTAYVEGTGHVIVKFSPLTDNPDARRWRDLLYAECCALRALGEHGLPAAETAVHEHGGRVFLESKRFDRVGQRGRLPALSLSMVDAEFAGEPLTWTAAARVLHGSRLLDAGALQEIAWLETFGHWIGNTDMHLGNLALAPERRQFRLLPAYDMLPMAYAPRRGELPSVTLRPPIQTADNAAVWQATRDAARGFWTRLAGDERVSAAFRAICAHNAQS